MKKNDISNKLFHILMPILLGTVVGIIFKDYNSYIETLERTFAVPPIVFPIVWSILYVLIGFWYNKFEADVDSKDKVIYYILLFVNYLFTPVLFYFKQIVLALVIVIYVVVTMIIYVVNLAPRMPIWRSCVSMVSGAILLAEVWLRVA